MDILFIIVFIIALTHIEQERNNNKYKEECKTSRAARLLNRHYPDRQQNYLDNPFSLRYNKT